MTMQSRMLLRVSQALCLATLALVANPTKGFAVCVSGTIEFWWELGNYCNSGERDCAGWRYTEASQDLFRPMREATFEVRNGSTVLATGDVDDEGNFSTCYTGPNIVTVAFFPEHKSGQFQIQSSNGSRWVFTCNGVTAGAANPCRFGSNGNPNAVMHVYQTAFTMLKNTVGNMGGANANFTNVAIRMDKAATNYDDNNTRAINVSGSSIDENGFTAVMHEMGHAVTGLASRLGYMGPDSSNKGFGENLSGCGGNTSWHFTSSDECAVTIYYEGVADFFGMMARIRNTTVNPCEGAPDRAEECHDDSAQFNPEDNWCPATGRDTARQVIDFLWDSFDPVTGNDNLNTPTDAFDDILYRYQNGRDNREKSENWCCTFWTCTSCNYDSKNMGDFEYHFQGETGLDGQTILGWHCL